MKSLKLVLIVILILSAFATVMTSDTLAYAQEVAGQVL